MTRPRARRAKRTRSSSAFDIAAPAERLALPRLPWRTLAMIVLATVAAFIWAVLAPFQFDDVGAIPQNPTIQRLWPPPAPVNLPPGSPVAGRPVVNYSLALNYALNDALGVDQRPDPDGPNKTVSYHVFNIIIHLVTGLLLFGIIRRTLHSGRIPAAWSGAPNAAATAVTLLWLLHPIQTEAVDYIIQRTELLVSAFYAATLYASIRAWDAGDRRARLGWSAAAFLACLLGMWSKEVMVTAPLIVILYDRAFHGISWSELRSTRRDRLWLYLALCLTWIPLAISVAGNARGGTVGFSHGVTWYEYLYTQAWAVSHYLHLVFWPNGLTYDYGEQPVLGIAPLGGVVLLTALGVATVVAWRRAPWLGFLGAWFFLLLAPSSSVVPIRTEIAAERRVYLAFAAVAAVLVIGVVELRRIAARNLIDAGRRRMLGVLERVLHSGLAFAGIVILLATATAMRSRMYNDPEALWRDAIAKRPNNPRAYDNLAAVVLAKSPSRVAEAEGLWRQAIAIDSTYIPAWTNLSHVEIERERFAEGRELLEHAVRINPDAVDASQRLGGVLVKLGDPQRAITLLERSTKVLPTDDAFATLATAYLAVGRPDDAAIALRRAVALNPQRLDAVAYLGALLVERGQLDEAVGYLEAAGRDPSATAPLLAILSLTEAQLGRVDEALAAARAASARAGSDANVYLRLGHAMLLAQRVDLAEQFLARAVQLDPNNLEAITRLGIAMAAGGKPAEAERLFRRALALQPGYVPAQQALAKLMGAK